MNLSIQIVVFSIVCSNNAFESENCSEFCRLPFADDTNFTFPEDSIFFLETSTKGGLSVRQACSVESAARNHPLKAINVLFTSPVLCENLNKRHHLALFKYGNVKLYRVDAAEISKGTPLHGILTSDKLKKSPHVVHHMSDILRYLILYKHGGIYSDLDVIMVQSLDKLPHKRNWASKEDDYAMAAGLMSFSKDAVGKLVLTEVIDILQNNYKPDNFCYQSIGVLLDALIQICDTDDIKEMTAKKCQGFHIYDTSYFYMLPPDLADLYFIPSAMKPNLRHLPHIFAFHVWNYITKSYTIHPESLYARLMAEFCPAVKNDNKPLTIVRRTREEILNNLVIDQNSETKTTNDQENAKTYSDNDHTNKRTNIVTDQKIRSTYIATHHDSVKINNITDHIIATTNTLIYLYNSMTDNATESQAIQNDIIIMNDYDIITDSTPRLEKDNDIREIVSDSGISSTADIVTEQQNLITDTISDSEFTTTRIVSDQESSTIYTFTEHDSTKSTVKDQKRSMTNDFKNEESVTILTAVDQDTATTNSFKYPKMYTTNTVFDLERETIQYVVGQEDTNLDNVSKQESATLNTVIDEENSTKDIVTEPKNTNRKKKQEDSAKIQIKELKLNELKFLSGILNNKNNPKRKKITRYKKKPSMRKGSRIHFLGLRNLYHVLVGK